MLTGNWVFNQTLTQPTDWTSEPLKFHRYGDATATYDTINYSGGTYWTVTLEPDSTGTEGYIEYINNSGGWNMADPPSPIITIIDDIGITNEFYNWFLENASEYLPPGPIKIEYGEDSIEDIWADIDDGGYTLETAGMILASDITVSADYSKIPLEEGVFTTNGTYYPQNTFGFSAVDVQVPSSGTPTYTNLGTSSTNLSGAYVTIDSTNTYVNSITISSGKSLTVVNGGTVNVTNTGTTNVNGGNTNRGVQVSDKLAIVDGYTVTDNNGDLLTPTYNSTTKALTYPAAYTVAGTTAQYTLSGDVTSINGALVRDTTAVSGSGTASSSYSNTYLAKWNSATTLSTGPHITISTSTPGSASGVAGDIWYQVL